MPSQLQRFTPVERLFHWSNAAAVFGLIATGVPIWLHLDKWRPGGINVLMMVHVWVFGALLVAGVAAYLIRRREKVAASSLRFNSGQKFNLGAFQALLTYMVATGGTRYVGKLLGWSKDTLHAIDEWHFYGALLIAVFLAGHLAMVFLVPRHRGILAAMITGNVSEDVARAVAREWVEAVRREEPRETVSTST